MIVLKPSPVSLPKPNPDVEYDLLGTAHWFAALAAQIDMERFAAELLRLNERLTKGDAWIKEHGESHPKWQRARELHLKIRDDIHHTQLALAVVERACWNAVLSTWVALNMAETHQDRRRALCETITGHPACDLPQTIWMRLAGDRSPPGAWPPEERDDWIEFKSWPYQHGPWEVDQLKELVERKRR